MDSQRVLGVLLKDMEQRLRALEVKRAAEKSESLRVGVGQGLPPRALRAVDRQVTSELAESEQVSDE